jgi:hypothetical protein
MNNSNKTWKQAFAEVNAMHKKALKKQEAILIHKLMQFENTNLFLNYLNFDYNGTYITDQYLDETGEFEVVPVEYYGETYLKALENKLTGLIKSQLK